MFHISQDGEPRPCRAVLKCPLGDVVHYESKEQARRASERASFLPPPTHETVREVEHEIQSRYPDVFLTLQSSRGEYVILHGIRFEKAQRNQGRGTQLMTELIEEADRRGWQLALTPSRDWGATSTARLERFYRRFGFVSNRGRYRDFTISEAMVRPPSIAVLP